MSNRTAESKINCLCGAVSIQGDIIAHPTFPIPVFQCCCDICRHATGSFGCTSVILRTAPPVEALNACHTYQSSSYGTRYFCKTCGSKLFVRADLPDKDPMWLLEGGTIDMDNVGDDVDRLSFGAMAYVADTTDGGLAKVAYEVAQNQGDDFKLKLFPHRWTEPPANTQQEIEQIWQFDENAKHDRVSQAPEKAHAECHCGAINIYITRPETSQINLDSLQKFLRQNNTKYVGKLCVCRSCRLATGVSFQPWTYIMPDCIFTASGEPIDFNFEHGLAQLPGLKVYRSSEDVRRSFCGTCGATVFFECKERPLIIDISVGLFRTDSGSMVEDWMEWNPVRISHSEECRDVAFMKLLTGKN